MGSALAPAGLRPFDPVAEAELELLAGDFGEWAAECYTIRDKANRLRRLALNPVQRAIDAAEREMVDHVTNARLYVLKARQGGVTTHQQAKALHLCWSTPGAQALTIIDKDKRRPKVFLITLRAIRHFPRELLPTLGDRATYEISFPGLDSHFYTDIAGGGDPARSLTITRLHCSEFAHYADPRGVLGSSEPSLVPSGSTVVLETTGSGFDSEGHAFWREARDGANGYRALFFPWWECDPRHYRLPLEAPDELTRRDLTGEERDLVERRGLDVGQIKWRRQKIAAMTADEFLKEYAEDEETCWLAPGGMFYDVEVLKALALRADAPEAQPTETHLGGALLVYGALREGERAILGADTAEGSGGDRSTFSARAFPSWRTLAAYQSSDVEPREFARILDTWGRRVGGASGPAFLVIEKNAHGITVIRHLRDDHRYPVDRIYHRVTADAARPDEAVGERIGWVTSGETKPLLLDAGRELLGAAFRGTAGLPPKSAIADAFRVRRGANGTIELTGRDMLVADMLAWMGRSAPLRTPNVRSLD